MSIAPPLANIPVGVIVERCKAAGPWIDFLWRPLSVLVGQPETAPWTKLTDDGARATFYAGAAAIELYRSETSNYRGNLALEAPSLWVVLRPTEADPPYQLFTVTADPAEGEALTEVGTDIVEPVPMPVAIQQAIAAFVAEHHVEPAVMKRKRDRANPGALARRARSLQEDQE